MTAYIIITEPMILQGADPDMLDEHAELGDIYQFSWHNEFGWEIHRPGSDNMVWMHKGMEPTDAGSQIVIEV